MKEQMNNFQEEAGMCAIHPKALQDRGTILVKQERRRLCHREVSVVLKWFKNEEFVLFTSS